MDAAPSAGSLLRFNGARHAAGRTCLSTTRPCRRRRDAHAMLRGSRRGVLGEKGGESGSAPMAGTCIRGRGQWAWCCTQISQVY